MSFDQPRLRGNAEAREGPYPLGEIPDSVVNRICRMVVHRLAVGATDISGQDFADIFAKSIGGIHLDKRSGITDIVLENCSWSAKTVKVRNPFKAKSVRLISGRNSPDFSYDIPNPRENLSESGKAILNVWNRRLNQSLHEYEDLRVVVFLRNMSELKFALLEYEATRFVPNDYEWKENDSKNKNFEAREKDSGRHCFTWQPHGSQFTVIKTIPGSIRRFKIKRHPGLIEPDKILEAIDYSDEWIEYVSDEPD